MSRKATLIGSSVTVPNNLHQKKTKTWTFAPMSIERAKRLLKQSENLRLEYKEAGKSLPNNLFDSICGMLNRDGEDILLGVDDEGEVTGVDPAHRERLMSELVTQSNNPNKLDPPFILFPQSYQFGRKWIIHLQVPASSQVHKTSGEVFDRSIDGDFKVKQPHRIAEIANRKRNHYTEGIIYPALQFSDFNQDLFPKIRNLIRSNNPNHPWLALDDEQMLQKAGLWRRDFESGNSGYTLAAVLLLGKDEVIQQILPHYKIDALVRRSNVSRYDDREYIQTNLIDAYEKLMDFVAKHLPDQFFLEGDQRVSLRTRIFREVVANLIVHREYTNAHPATLVIYADRVETINANNPHGEGPIAPDNFAPFPKNPLIAKFFLQLGRVDELGSGVLNVNRYLPLYADGRKPEFIEGSLFKIILPLDEHLMEESGKVSEVVAAIIDDTVSDTVSDAVKSNLKDLLMLIYMNPGQKREELADNLNVSLGTVKKYVSMLDDALNYMGSRKTGGYFVSDGLAERIEINISDK